MKKVLLAVIFALLAAIVGCGGKSGQVTPSPTPTPRPTATPTPTPTPTPSPTPADADERADYLISQMTLDEKLQLVHGHLTIEDPLGPRDAVGWVPGITRLAIPDIYYADANTIIPATALPAPIASAASWDLDLASKYGQVIGKEYRAYGMTVYLGGNVNLTAREPRDGRTFETKGEDPVLAGRITAAHLRAIQQEHVIASPKHFAMNDQETARTKANALIEERAARESDLLAFEIALKDSNAQAVMCAYNLVNSVYSCANPHLLSDVLKGDWGFQGFVYSDWYGTTSSTNSANAGLDQEQPGGYMFEGVWASESLKTAIQNGHMPLSRLDDMVHRVLRAMIVTGVMDDPADVQPIDAAADAAIAQEIAEQGAVLLKNDGGQLPLDASTVGSIAVIGSHADVGVLSGGGSAQIFPVGGAALTLPPACPPYTPQPGGAACLNSNQIFDPSSPLLAIRAKAPGATVQYDDGTNVGSAVVLATASNVAIVFVSQWESEGMDLPDLTFWNDQDALVAAVAAVNPHTIVVLQNGGPKLMPWLANVNAVLEVWYPGQKGGEAIANLLFGTVNPSGKLPITFPPSVASLPRPVIPIPNPPESTDIFDVDYSPDGFNVGYKWYDANGVTPLFPFGFGLSYTTFSFTNLHLTANPSPNVTFQMALDVTNTGVRAGAEVVQVYLGLPPDAGESPKRLVGWKKVFLQPGEQQHVTVDVFEGDASHPMSVWDTASGTWISPQGTYTVYVGNSSVFADVAAAKTLKVVGGKFQVH